MHNSITEMSFIVPIVQHAVLKPFFFYFSEHRQGLYINPSICFETNSRPYGSRKLSRIT